MPFSHRSELSLRKSTNRLTISLIDPRIAGLKKSQIVVGHTVTTSADYVFAICGVRPRILFLRIVGFGDPIYRRSMTLHHYSGQKVKTETDVRRPSPSGLE